MVQLFSIYIPYKLPLMKITNQQLKEFVSNVFLKHAHNTQESLSSQ